jgi:dynein light chain 1
LTTLFVSNNKIGAMDEINRLAQLPEIKNVLLLGNKIYDGMTKEEVRPLVIRRCPQLETLDGVFVSDQTRKQAEELRD